MTVNAIVYNIDIYSWYEVKLKLSYMANETHLVQL